MLDYLSNPLSAKKKKPSRKEPKSGKELSNTEWALKKGIQHYNLCASHGSTKQTMLSGRYIHTQRGSEAPFWDLSVNRVLGL